jgi:hypothetical protein
MRYRVAPIRDIVLFEELEVNGDNIPPGVVWYSPRIDSAGRLAARRDTEEVKRSRSGRLVYFRHTRRVTGAFDVSREPYTVTLRSETLAHRS